MCCPAAGLKVRGLSDHGVQPLKWQGHNKFFEITILHLSIAKLPWLSLRCTLTEYTLPTIMLSLLLKSYTDPPEIS